MSITVQFVLICKDSKEVFQCLLWNNCVHYKITSFIQTEVQMLNILYLIVIRIFSRIFSKIFFHFYLYKMISASKKEEESTIWIFGKFLVQNFFAQLIVTWIAQEERYNQIIS